VFNIIDIFKYQIEAKRIKSSQNNLDKIKNDVFNHMFFYGFETKKTTYEILRGEIIKLYKSFFKIIRNI
ncbi:hypothetical protein, partial [Agrobacterium vitis]